MSSIELIGEKTMLLNNIVHRKANSSGHILMVLINEQQKFQVALDISGN